MTAIRLGRAETKSILRRFVRNNIQHPTYKAFAERGRAVKTIFLCRYLHSEGLRREINEGLNVIEQWNSANDFLFFARHGEMVSNRREDHEISMLAAAFAPELHTVHQHLHAILAINTAAMASPRKGSPRLDPAGLGACEPLRLLRTRHGDPADHRLIQMTLGDRIVGPGPISMIR